MEKNKHDAKEAPESERKEIAKQTILNCEQLIQKQENKQLLLSQFKIKYAEVFGSKIELYGMSLSSFFRKYGRNKFEMFSPNGNSGAATVRFNSETRSQNLPSKGNVKSTEMYVRKSGLNDAENEAHAGGGNGASVKDSVSNRKKAKSQQNKSNPKTSDSSCEAIETIADTKAGTKQKYQRRKGKINQKLDKTSAPKLEVDILQQSGEDNIVRMDGSQKKKKPPKKAKKEMVRAPHGTILDDETASSSEGETVHSLQEDQLKKIESELEQGAAALVFTDSDGRCNVLRVKSFEVASGGDKSVEKPDSDTPPSNGLAITPAEVKQQESSITEANAVNAEWLDHFHKYARFYRSWVEPFSEDAGCTFYMDRRKRFAYKTNSVGYELLCKMMDRNENVLAVNHKIIGQKSSNPFKTASEGEPLYIEWKNMLAKGEEFKWSQQDFCHPGFQRMYLHLKSFQAVAETWSMLERIDASGLFSTTLPNASGQLRIINLFGGPSYELLAMEMYFEKFLPNLKLDMVAVDSCNSWDVYVRELGYRFEQWNLETQDLVEKCNFEKNKGPIYLNLSYVQINAMKVELIAKLKSLLLEDKVQAIFISDHDLIQTHLCDTMQNCGIQVEKLMDQSKCRDDRQLLLLNKRNCSVGSFPEMDRPKSYTTVFPNVPYSAAERGKLADSRNTAKFRGIAPSPRASTPTSPRPNIPRPPNFVRSGEWAASFSDFIRFYESWVNPLTPDGNCIFFMDQEKALPHNTNMAGYALLTGMMSINKKALHANHAWIGSLEHPWDIAAEGECLYRERHRARQRFLNPGQSQNEATHPGFQRMYLHIKSFQCFSETWSLLERAKATGIFDSFSVNKPRVIRFASIFGGPAFELLAANMFFAMFYPGTKIEMVSLDPCGVWREYAEHMGCRFECWDVNEGHLMQRCRFGDGQPPYFMTYLLIPIASAYCETDRTMDMFQELLADNCVQAVFVNDRTMTRTQFCKMMEERGMKTVKLLDQSIRQDDRMLAFVSDETAANLKPDQISNLQPIFPDVPYSIDERPCVNMLQKGWCPFGEGCWHSHNVQPAAPPFYRTNSQKQMQTWST